MSTVRQIGGNVSAELQELRRRVREYEKMILNWRRAYYKEAWQAGDTLNEANEKMLKIATSLYVERQINRRQTGAKREHGHKN